MTFETAAKFLADAAQRVAATASCRRLLAIAWWLVRYRLLSAVACWSYGWISVWNTEVWLVVLWLKWIAIGQGLLPQLVVAVLWPLLPLLLHPC
jgi:hypothetical protein